MLNVTKPDDQESVSQLPYYIRETRAALNALQALSSNIEITSLTLEAGTTTLVIPTDLSTALFEIVLISSVGVCNIESVRGGTHGQIKVFIFGDGNISFIDAAKGNSGTFYLNQLPVGSAYNSYLDDVLALVNINGNGSTTHGYWKELWRQNSVK